jgi:hypothetical protein
MPCLWIQKAIGWRYTENHKVVVHIPPRSDYDVIYLRNHLLDGGLLGALFLP